MDEQRDDGIDLRTWGEEPKEPELWERWARTRMREQMDEILTLRDKVRELTGLTERLQKTVEAAETWVSERKKDTVKTFEPGEQVRIIPLCVMGRIRSITITPGRPSHVTYAVAYEAQGFWVLGTFQENELEAGNDLLPARSEEN